MDRIRAAIMRNLDDALQLEVVLASRRGADVMGFVRVADVDCIAVGVRVNRRRRDAQLPTRAHHSDGDLAPIGDEDLVEELALDQPTARRGWLGLTTSPSLTQTWLTLPATVVTISFCIFIASSTATTSPSFTLSPAFTGSLTIKPCMGAITVPSPVLGGGAAVEGPHGPTAPGVTVMPAPVTPTLNTSPSTSTSNSAVETAGGGGSAGSATSGESGGAGAVGAATGSGFDPSLAFRAGPRK